MMCLLALSYLLQNDDIEREMVGAAIDESMLQPSEAIALDVSPQLRYPLHNLD